MELTFNAFDKARGPVIYPPDAIVKSSETGLLDVNDCVSVPMVFSGIFSATECSLIMDLGRQAPQFPGRMLRAQHHLISSRTAWLGVRSDTLWIYEKMWQIFSSVNRWYKFTLSGMVDELQFSTYGFEGGIAWHLDTGSGQTSTRKISLSLQLTAGSDYSGGDLEFAGHSRVDDARDQGTVVLFPSFLVHRIAPVTRGARFSLVAWAHGPPFK